MIGLTGGGFVHGVVRESVREACSTRLGGIGSSIPNRFKPDRRHGRTERKKKGWPDGHPFAKPADIRPGSAETYCKPCT